MTLFRLFIISFAMCLITTNMSAQQPKKSTTATAVKKTTTAAKKPTTAAQKPATAAKKSTPAKKAVPVVTRANAVDLGLPSGTLWADRNVGAEAPDAYGGLYRYGNRGKGNGEGTPKDENIIGTRYDVAQTQMGDHWCLPSAVQLEELLEHCAFDYVTFMKVPGYIVTGPNGNEIFLPLTGCMYNYGRSQAGQFAMYASGERAGYQMYVCGEIYCLSLWAPRDGFDNKMSVEGVGMGNPIRAVYVE